MDRRWSNARKLAAAWIVAGLMSVVPITGVFAQAAMDPEAEQILNAMSKYLSGLAAFSVSFDTDFDVIAPTGQKLKFASSGDIAVQRPGKLHVTRKGTVADVVFVADGEKLTIFGQGMNKYYQQAAASIDDAISVIRDDIGYDAPGADLLTSKLLDPETTDMVSGIHVGMTSIGGVPVHHLAFRGERVDWQLWVQDGDTPLPVQYVITSKFLAGAPEYSLRLSNWDVAPSLDAALFTFVPPTGAEEVSALRLDDIGQFMNTWE